MHVYSVNIFLQIYEVESKTKWETFGVKEFAKASPSLWNEFAIDIGRMQWASAAQVGSVTPTSTRDEDDVMQNGTISFRK